MFKFTNIVMYFAPIGVGAAMAYTVGHLGISVLLPLGKLVLTAYAALIVFVGGVLLPIAFAARLQVRRFIRYVAEPATIAFATSTSEAALPRAMEAMEEFGVPRQIVAFVIPAGYSFNLDGSTLYLALASIFVAQAAGIHMSWTAQLGMVTHAHADQQRGRRRSARGLSRPARHGFHVSSAHRTHLHHSRRRCFDRYGPHFGERSR